jgi:hypothetical protein
MNQEEDSLFAEVTASAIRISRPTSIRGLSMKRKVFERNMDTPDEFLVRILGCCCPQRGAQTNSTRDAERIEEFLNIYRGI